MQLKTEHDPAEHAKETRDVNWVVVALIVFAIAVAALGAWADSLGGSGSPSSTPTISGSVTPVSAPAAP